MSRLERRLFPGAAKTAYTEYQIEGDPNRLTMSSFDVRQSTNNPYLFVFPYDWQSMQWQNGN
jgi:hypothetical protein